MQRLIPLQKNFVMLQILNRAKVVKLFFATKALRHKVFKIKFFPLFKRCTPLCLCDFVAIFLSILAGLKMFYLFVSLVQSRAKCKS